MFSSTFKWLFCFFPCQKHELFFFFQMILQYEIVVEFLEVKPAEVLRSLKTGL